MVSREWISKRNVFTIMMFLGTFNLYSMRMNLSVAIVAMVEPPKHTANQSFSGTGCPGPDSNKTNSKVQFFKNNISTAKNRTVQSKFQWDESTQGFVLGSFFYGYIILQFPGGYLADRFGGKIFFGFGILMLSVLSIISPLAAKYHYVAFSAVRFVMGLFTGYSFPCLHSMTTKWAPDNEIGTMLAASGAGCYAGIVLSNLLTGLLSNSNFLGGWPSSFYIFGALGIVWCIFWQLLVYNSPETHPRITKAEKDYIIQSRRYNSNTKNVSTPWRAIFSSLPIWAAFTNQWAHQFTGYLLMTDMPKYLDNILGVPLTENAVFNAVPNFAGLFICMGSGYVTDLIVSKNWVSLTTARKFMDFISALVPAICFCLITLWPCDESVIIFLLMTAIIMTAPVNAGVHMCYVGMAPAYAGTIYGVANMLSNTTGFIVPQFVGWLTQESNDIYGWGKAFYFTSAISVIFGLFFVFYGTARIQAWAQDENEEEVLERSRLSSKLSMCSFP